MSFILDALKKSEIERQRQAIPGLMDSGTPAARAKFPLWAAALVALLGINLAVLVVVLTRGGAPATPAGAAAPAAQSAPDAQSAPALRAAAPESSAAHTPAAGAAPAAQDHFSPLDAAPVYAPEIPAEGGAVVPAPEPASSQAASNATPALPGGRQASPSGGAPALRAGRARDPVLVEDAGRPDDEVLPSISEINLAGGQALPELHLDVHVFATKPSERFVYINMRKYREGATLAEGPVLERIRRDGVVLNFNGLRFVLPRQQ
jgi:general secretion pathway protein B